MTRILIVGASRGLGRALVEGLPAPGDAVIGVSRRAPSDIQPAPNIELQWIEADMSDPSAAVQAISESAPGELDVIIYNLGIWESRAFEDDYRFDRDADTEIIDMINVNITGAILTLKHLIDRLKNSEKPQVILTGSTSAQRQCGRPEVTFGACKHALNGIADALREGYRDRRLAVTCLQLGYLNTDEMPSTKTQSASEASGEMIPLADVVTMTRALMTLSPASFVRELTLPAILDDRF
ncbi:MAG: SDR family oxidoreductase [Natronospirillum sp.]|uniref:SDR family NAD(P)-dependent oxidoreductase n=1 Tax=Natronospirillum sp. TaxID=2812955 RepID=UPI0025E69CF1|nr:SDR family oxidoreductase [Natronospirillum sp.]MCH8551923.1 SDR family oxidoreductase [Natronospirillum sp.]